AQIAADKLKLDVFLKAQGLGQNARERVDAFVDKIVELSKKLLGDE
ncbi:unnamed protein product, partial [marine sediment metagenome]